MNIAADTYKSNTDDKKKKKDWFYIPHNQKAASLSLSSSLNSHGWLRLKELYEGKVEEGDWVCYSAWISE